jgi:methionine-rich copper-binding protein CopC
MRAPAPLRAVALTLLCGLALLLGAGQALAHTRLIGSDPADGASLATAPSHVSLTFNENMQAEFTTVTVVGPDRATWSTGPVGVEGPTVGVDLRPLGPAGDYQIGYRVVSDDGHPVTGAITFTLTAPGPGAEVSPTPAASVAPPPAAAATATPAESGGGAPVWPWIAVAVLLVGGGVFAALRLGR